MGIISPIEAATLAETIYDAQNEFLARGVIAKNKVLSRNNKDNSHLKAEVGLRLINASAGFGMCVRGGTGYENDLFIMFRGTTTSNYGADFFTDARFGVETSQTALPVHIGFNHAFTSMMPSIQDFLSKHGDATGTIHVIGHSLGGAVAALAADWLSSAGRNVKLYTFGAPKPGLERFARALTTKIGEANIYRTYHTCDPVPMVPVYPFTHSPTTHCGYHLPKEGLVSFAAHKMANYKRSVESKSWQAIRATSEHATYEQSIEHWLKSDKPINPANPKTWEWINAGLTWVLKKVVKGAAALIQAPFASVLTLADKIAWMLRRGVELLVEVSEWVLRLMRKILQALGMKIVQTASELTQAFMRMVLRRLMQRMNDEAQRAIRDLINKR